MPLEINQDVHTARLDPRGALAVPGGVEVDKGGGMRAKRLPCLRGGGVFTAQSAPVVVVAPSPVAVDRVPMECREGGERGRQRFQLMSR